MNCSELEQVIFPYVDGELDEADAALIEQHLAQCASCSTRVHDEKRFKSELKLKVQSALTPAPAHLRARVVTQVQKAHRQRVAAQWLRWSAAAAAVTLVTSAAYFSYRPMVRQRFVEDAALRHAKRFPLEIQHPSAEQIEAWFGGKLDHRIAVPRLPNVVPAGARLLNVQAKQAAYIRYDEPSGIGRVGLFVYDDKQNETDFEDLPNATVGASHGYNVVSWREGDVVYQLVSDLDEADIRKMLSGSLKRAPASPPARPALEVQPASLQR